MLLVLCRQGVGKVSFKLCMNLQWTLYRENERERFRIFNEY
jgi:hypothetical protein